MEVIVIQEIWRDIPGYEGLYQASNLGNIKSLHYGMVMQKRTNPEGYQSIRLCVNNKRVKKNVHRLIALAFIPNPNNLPQINHIDENKENNQVDNLEWCNCRYNITYGSRNGAHVRWISKPVAQYDDLWNVVAEYRSATEAAKSIGVGLSLIGACCKIKEHTAHGYHFQYINDVPRTNAKRL